MKTTHSHLLARIEAYSPDDSEASFPYSARLARDNDWSPDYARRVIHEYKRFAFLAMVSGHPVTPSDQVDQAWHLHMIYTRSYWMDFCGEVLRSPLHHGPTKGMSEQGKFVDWYQRTLDQYRAFFGEDPPADIWPPAGKRFGEDIRFVRVNSERSWVVRKPRWWRWLASRRGSLRPRRQSWRLAAFLGIATPVVFASCQRISTAGMLSSGITGPDFLGWFSGGVLLAIALAALLRNALRNKGTISSPPSDPHAVSYLAGGSNRVFDAVVVNLVHQGKLEFDRKSARLSRTASPPPAPSTVERSVHDLIPTAPLTAGIAETRRRVPALMSPIRRKLRQEGLLLTPGQVFHATMWPLLIALIPMVIGALRIMQGIERDRLVGFLSILMVLAGLGILSFFAKPPRRTRAGDRALDTLKLEQGKPHFSSIATDPTLTVGLFGIACLQGTAYADLGDTLTPKSQAASVSGGCSGDTGGDSGGDGCGGGGGCGGCGGCGG